MAKIYLPKEYINYSCKVFNTNQSNVVYDIYYTHDYAVKQTTATYNSNTQCDSINTYTDDIYYRSDFPQILLMTCLFIIIMFWVPWRILCRMFRRWL